MPKKLARAARQAAEKLRAAGHSGAAKEFKGLRWLLARNWENLTYRQKATIRDLERANRRTFRAWQLKEELRDVFSLPIAKARHALDDWLYMACRSKIGPVVELARRIRKWRTQIEATIEYGFTNGLANNASIGRIRANARGFHDPEAVSTMIMLDRGGLTPNLPWAS